MSQSSAAMDLGNSYIVDQLTTVVYSLRMEIAIFCLAFFGHAILFGKRSILPGRKRQQQPAQKTTVPSCGLAPHAESKAMPLVAEDLCKGCSGKPEVVEAHLRSRLVDIQDIESALVGLLQSAGRIPATELLKAVLAVAKDFSLSLNSTLGEWLLRGLYAAHATADFNELLSEIESIATKGVCLFPGVGIQALKGALRQGDLQASFARLEGIRGMWEGPANSPSAAPKALLQWIARLALQQDSLPKLIEKLKALGLFQEAFPLLLNECAHHGSASIMRETEALGRKEGLVFTAATYCVLVKSAEQVDAAEKVFAEALDRVGPNKDLYVGATDVAFAHTSSSFATAILQALPADPPAEVAGKLLQLCSGKDRDAAKILGLYKQYFSNVDLSNDTSAERLIAEACIRSGKLDILKTMLATTTDSTKRVGLLKQIGMESSLDDAFVVFRAIPERGACLYNAVIDLCIEGKQQKAAQQVMDEAIQAGVADTVTYNTIIKAQLLFGNGVEARKTVQLMRTAGLQPNCVTFNELLDSCTKCDAKDVWPLLDEMQACGVKPNHITCSILLKTIKATSTARNVEKVLEVMDAMTDEIDEVLLSSVVEACIRAGRVDLLMPHLKRQCSSKRIQLRGPHTYGSIIRAYGFVNDVQGAWSAWREMRTRQIVPTAVTLGCMVEAMVSNGDPEGGYELIQDMLGDERCQSLVNAVIYGSVLKGFSHAKQFDRFWSVYQEMLTHKIEFSITTFNTMVDACARCNQMSKISELLKSMVSQGIEPNLITYSAILKGYCQENRLDEAFELMEGMVQTTKFKPDEIMYNTLLDGCARKGLYDKGIALLGDMEASGINPTNFTLSVIVKLCSRAKRLERAFTMVGEISTKYRFKPNVHVYDNLIQACIQNKDLRRSINVFEQLLNAGVRPDTRSYSLLLRACVDAGEAQDAAGFMRAAVGLRGVHPQLMGHSANMLQPQGGLPQALVSEIIEGIAGHQCHDEALAVALLKDLRSKPNVKVDPKLQMRLTTQAVGTSRQPRMTR